jgi:hypothetical protein
MVAYPQKLKSAEQFYNAKVEELSTNLKDLENVIQRKQTNARTVEEGTSRKHQGASILYRNLADTRIQCCARRLWRRKVRKPLSHDK